MYQNLQLLKHSLLYFVGRVVPGLVTIGALIVYTRFLTVREYGIYSMAIVASGLVYTGLFQWLSAGISRFLPDYKTNKKKLLNTVFVGFAGSCLCSIIVGVVVKDSKFADYSIIYCLAIIAGWAQAFFDLNTRIENAELLPVRYGILNTLKALLTFALGCTAVMIGWGVIGIVVGLIVGPVFVVLPRAKSWFDGKTVEFDWKLLKRLLIFGVPLSMTYVFNLITDSSGKVILGTLIGPEAVGLFSAAFDLTQQTLGMLVGVVNLAAYPLIINAIADKEQDKANQHLEDNLKILFAIALPATVGLIVLSDSIACLFIGESYRKYAPEVIAITSIAILFSGIKSYYYDYAFHISRKMKGMVYSVAVMSISSVALSYTLIIPYGVTGAALSTLGGFIVGAITSWHFGRKVHRLPKIPKELCKVILASAIMGIVLIFMQFRVGIIYLLTQIIVGLVVYACCLYFLNYCNLRCILGVRFARR